MRSRRPSPEHQEAVTRRLAQLSAELDAVRPGASPSPPPPPSPPPAPPAPPPSPDRLPVPGRHAARRRRDRPAPWEAVEDLVPQTLRGRVLLGSAHLGVIALLVAAGLAVTSWWVVRSDPEPVPGPRLETVAELDTPLVDLVPTETAAPSNGATSAAEGRITIDVAGKVRRPGIAVLPAGSRVHDALEAAGGARPGADLAGLNLARVLVDGEQVLVGLPGAPAPVVPGVAAPAPGTPGAALVDLNTADQVLLETLPQVGPVTAAAILAWRTEHGAFTAVEELLEVDGIGEATLAQLAPLVTV